MSAISLNQREKERKALRKKADQLRKEGGLYLKGLRERVNLTQRQLALQVGFHVYTRITMIEKGKEKLPPKYVVSYALALKVPDVEEFTKQCIKFFDQGYHEGLTYNSPDLG